MLIKANTAYDEPHEVPGLEGQLSFHAVLNVIISIISQ